MAKKSALQKIESHEKLCRIMQKQTFEQIKEMQERIKRLGMRGVPSVVEYLRSGLYKYAAGNCSSSMEANELKLQLQKQGFTDAFVVKFEGTSFESQEVRLIRKN